MTEKCKTCGKTIKTGYTFEELLSDGAKERTTGTPLFEDRKFIGFFCNPCLIKQRPDLVNWEHLK